MLPCRPCGRLLRASILRPGCGRLGANSVTSWHRKVTGSTNPFDCTATNNEQFMDTDRQAWRRAVGLKDWSFLLNTADHGGGSKAIVVRLTEHGAETARDTARATFR